MLSDKDAMATIAVKNLASARKFYVQTLGFVPRGDEAMGVLMLQSGGSSIVVYESKYAGTNQATSATWGVGGELEAIVRTLKEKGVAFERYDLPQVRHEGDLHVWGDFKGAWFRDPDGNILHVNNQ
jgi:catechol 2,3-dioxygenase-like lactoylglutathione lyase family enzyme